MAEGPVSKTGQLLARKANKKGIVSARQAVQFSLDARALAVQRQEESVSRERDAAAGSCVEAITDHTLTTGAGL
jgi:hypothetical protein